MEPIVAQDYTAEDAKAYLKKIRAESNKRTYQTEIDFLYRLHKTRKKNLLLYLAVLDQLEKENIRQVVEDVIVDDLDRTRRLATSYGRSSLDEQFFYVTVTLRESGHSYVFLKKDAPSATISMDLSHDDFRGWTPKYTLKRGKTTRTELYEPGVRQFIQQLFDDGYMFKAMFKPNTYVRVGAQCNYCKKDAPLLECAACGELYCSAVCAKQKK